MSLSTKSGTVGRLMTLHCSHPKESSFGEYSATANPDEGQLFINFLGDSFKVESVKERYEAYATIVLELVSSVGQSHSFYAVASDPFNTNHKAVYGML
jgi:hypothetical protein